MTVDWFMNLRTDRLSGLLISCRGIIEICLNWTLLRPRRSSVNPPQVQAVLSQGPSLTEQINSAREERTLTFSSLCGTLTGEKAALPCQNRPGSADRTC